MKIELSELRRIIARAKDINITLNQELGNMSTTLEDICSNVNSSELTASNQKITTAIIDVSEKVKTSLPEIISFLENQINSYDRANQGALQEIDSLISTVDDAML